VPQRQGRASLDWEDSAPGWKRMKWVSRLERGKSWPQLSHSQVTMSKLFTVGVVEPVDEEVEVQLEAWVDAGEGEKEEEA
jgi:hypothetical protein